MNEENLEWNKDKGCMEEIQRIENIIHTCIIENDFSGAFNSIGVLKGIISTLLSENDTKRYNMLRSRFKAVSQYRQDNLKSAMLMDLYDFIQGLLVIKGIHLRTEKDHDVDDI